MKVEIFEPALCCETGLCGVTVDPELLRISTFLNKLKKKGHLVKRYNLNSSPMEFITNTIANEFINKEGVEKLPITIFDDVIIVVGRYPTNEELLNLFNIKLEDLD